MQIWGFAHRAAVHALDTVTIEIAEPGTVRVDIGPFRPYAVLDGRSNDIIGATGSDLAYYLQRKLEKAFPKDDLLETQAVWRECLALADLVRMIFSDGHGGAVILVPSETGEWSESLKPFPYRLKTPGTTVRDAIRKELNDAGYQGRVFEELSQAPLPDDFKNRVMATFHQSNGGGKRAAIWAIAALAKVDGDPFQTSAVASTSQKPDIRSRYSANINALRMLSWAGRSRFVVGVSCYDAFSPLVSAR